MRSTGVICEFNPFHTGHGYLVSRMREAVGEDGCVVALMSGRFVQRGEPALCDPYIRAEAALAGGADLVLELPFPWCAGSAEHFATAGIRTLARLGVDTVTFGSECGDADLLLRAAHATGEDTFAERYAFLCRSGKGTTAAYLEAIRARLSDCPTGFPASNDLLGIAYFGALDRLAAAGEFAPTPMVVRREGAAYNETEVQADRHPSATALRTLICTAVEDPVALAAILEDTMPARAVELFCRAAARGEAPITEAALLPFYHTYYRLCEADALAAYAELSGGLAAHIVRVARETATPAAFPAALRTKQYTDARLRRALLFGVLGVCEADLRHAPTYTTLLAANTRGCAFLKARQKAHMEVPPPLVVVTKPADAPEGRQRILAERVDALYTSLAPMPQAAGAMYRRTPIIAT